MGTTVLERRRLCLGSVAAGLGAAAIFPSVIWARTGADQVLAVENIGALKLLPNRPPAVIVAGRSTAGDGGGGVFVWDEQSQTPPDDVLVVKLGDDSHGRFRRLISGFIDARWFGSDFQAAIDAGQTMKATVQFSGICEFHSTLVLRSETNIAFASGSKLVWKGDSTRVCVQTDPSNVTSNVNCTGLSIDTGPNFSGTALSIHAAHNIHADVVTLVTTGATSTALKLCADSSGGGTPLTKRNVSACSFGAIIQQGQCGTCIETCGGDPEAGYHGGPQVVTLNTIGSVFAENCARFGIHLKQWTDNNSFPGVNRISLNGDGAIGLQIGGRIEKANRGVYSNNFGIVAIDTFGTRSGRVATCLSRSKLTVIGALYNNPPAEGGILKIEDGAESYDVAYHDDQTKQIVRYERKVDHVEGAVGYNSSSVVSLDTDTAASVRVDDPSSPGRSTVFTAIVTADTAAASGVIWCEVATASGSVGAFSMYAGSDFWLASHSGRLAGRSGPPRKLSVSPGRDGRLYVENRLARPVTVVVTILGRHQRP
jgi:hypothetical protein